MKIKKRQVKYGLDISSYRTPLLWADLPNGYILISFLGEFKQKINFWKCKTCICRLCQTYHQKIGYILNEIFISALTKL